MTPSKGEDSESSDSRKTFITFMFDLFRRFFWIFLFYFLPPATPVVVVDFIGTMKSI